MARKRTNPRRRNSKRSHSRRRRTTRLIRRLIHGLQPQCSHNHMPSHCNQNSQCYWNYRDFKCKKKGSFNYYDPSGPAVNPMTPIKKKRGWFWG